MTRWLGDNVTEGVKKNFFFSFTIYTCYTFLNFTSPNITVSCRKCSKCSSELNIYHGGPVWEKWRFAWILFIKHCFIASWLFLIWFFETSVSHTFLTWFPKRVKKNFFSCYTIYTCYTFLTFSSPNFAVLCRKCSKCTFKLKVFRGVYYAKNHISDVQPLGLKLIGF